MYQSGFVDLFGFNMNDLRTEMKRRIRARGPKGELLSLLTGQESEAEVRKFITEIAQEFQYAKLCPAGESHLQCPFRALAGLSYHSLRDIAETMSFEDCVKLFDLELESRAKYFTPDSDRPTSN